MTALELVIDAHHVAHQSGACPEYHAPGLGSVVVDVDPDSGVITVWDEFPFPLCADCCP